MKKKGVFWKACLFFGFIAVNTLTIPEVKAFFDMQFPLFALSQQITSADDIAHFIWRHFSFETDRTQFGQDDYWQTPEELLIHGKGDCEDFARFASELLKMQGMPSFLLSVYGDRYSHTVCVFKENGKFNVIDGSQVIRYEAKNLNQLSSKIYPFWKNAAIVIPSPDSKRGKILHSFQQRVKGWQALATSA